MVGRKGIMDFAYAVLEFCDYYCDPDEFPAKGFKGRVDESEFFKELEDWISAYRDAGMSDVGIRRNEE